MDLSEIILTWYSISQGKQADQSSIFFKFISLWIAFNAIYDLRYDDEPNPANKIRRFANEKFILDRHLILLDSDREYRQAVINLADKGIIDMQKPEDEPFKISRFGHLWQVMRCIYAVRNNLFHGDKQPGEPRDTKVVESSYIVLSRLIEPWMDKKRIDEWSGA
jgi:hypothetical protein